MPASIVVSLEQWTDQREPRCAQPGCDNPVECWDEDGRLCNACALEHELFDRDLRWASLAPPA